MFIDSGLLGLVLRYRGIVVALTCIVGDNGTGFIVGDCWGEEGV